MITEELAKLQALAEEPAGARFRRADLQLHTPVDRNFRAAMHLEKTDDRAAFAQAYVQRAIKPDARLGCSPTFTRQPRAKR